MDHQDDQRTEELNSLRLDVRFAARRLRSALEGSTDTDERQTVEAGLASYRVCKASHRGNEEPPCRKLDR
jgi:hypothetical protein